MPFPKEGAEKSKKAQQAGAENYGGRTYTQKEEKEFGRLGTRMEDFHGESNGARIGEVGSTREGEGGREGREGELDERTQRDWLLEDGWLPGFVRLRLSEKRSTESWEEDLSAPQICT